MIPISNKGKFASARRTEQPLESKDTRRKDESKLFICVFKLESHVLWCRHVMRRLKSINNIWTRGLWTKKLWMLALVIQTHFVTEVGWLYCQLFYDRVEDKMTKQLLSQENSSTGSIPPYSLWPKARFCLFHFFGLFILLTCSEYQISKSVTWQYKILCLLSKHLNLQSEKISSALRNPIAMGKISVSFWNNCSPFGQSANNP